MMQNLTLKESLKAALGGAAGAEEAPFSLRKRRRPGETLIQSFLFACGAISILTTLGIVVVLGREALLFFADDAVSLWEFFTTTQWQPAIGKFGVWSLVNATFMTSLFAMLVALPIGLAVAIYLSEYASPRVRGILKPILEVLAGIPTVVYGYFALNAMTPVLRAIFGEGVVEVYNTASAGLVMGILILPLVTSMSEDALSAVPRSLREASYALGATRLETAIKVVTPAALSGISAAFILAISRAVGETMIVALAAGAGPAFTFNPFKAAETMTGHIVRISGGDLSYNSIDYNSLFAIGLLLFLITLALNIVSRQIVRRFREVYE
jgi:phosphate transport system permease protein